MRSTSLVSSITVWVLLAAGAVSAALASAAALAADTAPGAGSERIAIIGTGGVGSALGERWGQQGHRIVYGSRNPDDERVQAVVARSGEHATAVSIETAAQETDIIVLAIPWSAAESVVSSLGALDGRIIIDPINAMRFMPEHIELAHPAAAEAIAAWAPGAHVVKALNTTSHRNMRNPPDDYVITMPIAGDSEAAKARTAALIRALGLEVRDVGPLSNARHVEAMGVLYVYTNSMQSTGLEYTLVQTRGRPRQ
jgi:predicted dinucleotide-binding enzyme